MTGLMDARTGLAPVRARRSRGLIGWVCTSNPFYVLSAMLVSLGLWVSFGAQASATHSWALLLGMAAYTLMLAVTAGALVRLLGVWDDVRTVMLLAVLMILATSVTFDVVLARDPERGVACYLVGLLMAVVLSEAMLRGARLRLPALFRAPYYLALALFFLYPAAIAPLVLQPKGEALPWAMFGFSPAAGLVALTLLPAIRRGRDYVRGNGSPWPWAWYPWSLFAVLGFAAIARSALLCWSMHHLEGAVREPYIFGFYFLAPIGLAVGVLLLEFGIVEGSRGARRVGLAIPPVLVVLAMVGHRPEMVYQAFLGQFIARVGGTPLYVTLLASIAFYAYAALRRVPSAMGAMTAAVAALALVGPGTLDLGELSAPRPLPLAAASALLLVAGISRRDAWRCLFGTIGLVACSVLLMPGHGEEWPRGPVALGLIWMAALVLGAIFRDFVGALLRAVAAGMGVVAGLVIVSGRVDAGPSWAMAAAPLVIASVLAIYGALLRRALVLAAGGLVAALWGIALGVRGYDALRHLVTGLDYIALGLLAFGLAILTSVSKAGALGRGGEAKEVVEPPV